MNPKTVEFPTTEDNRRELINELEESCGPNWADDSQPGSLGCHELLDRTSMIANNLEEYVRSHPACVRNAEWFALAERAAEALHELYQKVGSEHLSSDCS